MSSPAAFDTLETYLREQWPLVQAGVPLVFENEPYPLPDAVSAFVLVEIYSDRIAMESIGSGSIPDNRWREYGTMLMHVCVPNMEGSRVARQYAWKLIDLFRTNELGAVRFQNSDDGMSVGASERNENDGNYFRMTVRVDFERDD